MVEASTLSTDFVCLSVSQTCANYLANTTLMQDVDPDFVNEDVIKR